MLRDAITKILSNIGINNVELTVPPRSEMGDLSFACFGLAKEWKKSPAEAALELKSKIPAKGGSASGGKNQKSKIIERIENIGPYVNFFLNPAVLAREVLAMAGKKDFGQSKIGRGQKIMVEFAHPNTHKAFHIGHLRNITTGESLARIFTNAGYKVVRANYQGDVGLHIAKCLYGILKITNSKLQIPNKFQIPKFKTIDERVKFLGEAYAAGHKAYEESAEAKKEIEAINEKIYSKNKEIKKLYKETRKWSLEYFNKIYQRVGVKFDRLYFESETFERGKKLVLANLKKGIFKESEGAIIFEGEKYGLHNRVFITGKGLPTYEAKDVALAETQMKEYKPDAIFHVVAREQTAYFQVLFKALEMIFPAIKGKESHLLYGWVSLKEGKMSSRAGNVVLGEWLLDTVKEKIAEVMKEHEIKNRDEVVEKVAVAAVKYMFLRTGASNDIVFGLEESVSLTGDSGPYLLYIVARIKSILRKLGIRNWKLEIAAVDSVQSAEKKLLLDLSNFPEITEAAAAVCDPSKIAHYLLDLAQDFNNFYNGCPVLQSEGATRDFRLALIKVVADTMTRGLYLLGIEAVEEM